MVSASPPSHSSLCSGVWLSWQGAQLIGEIECGYIGTVVEAGGDNSLPAGFGEKCREHNQALLASLKEDEHASSLLKLTQDDARLGRMSFPVAGKEFGVCMCALCHRASALCPSCRT